MFEDACFETIGPRQGRGFLNGKDRHTAEIAGFFKIGLTRFHWSRVRFPSRRLLRVLIGNRPGPASSSNGRSVVFQWQSHPRYAGPGSRLALAASRVRPDGGRLCRSKPSGLPAPRSRSCRPKRVYRLRSRAGLGGWLVEVRGGTVDPLIAVTTSSDGPAKETGTGTGYTTPAAKTGTDRKSLDQS